MLLFFEQKGVQSFNDITGKTISAFLATPNRIGEPNHRNDALIVSCPFSVIFIAWDGTQNDLTEKLPVVKANRQFKLPKVWRQEDILSVLNSIDRGNPVGKRDYAILMLITRYGLRSADVKAMKLSNLRWNENVIEITQNKTQNSLRLPLLRDVGWAIIDYLQHGRPPSEHSEVFLTCTIPIRPFGIHSQALNSILAKTSPTSGCANPTRSTKRYAFPSPHLGKRHARK